MKVYKTKTWQHELTASEGNAILFGANIFDYEWVSTGENVAIKDPLYNQDYKFPVYHVTVEGKQYEFAAGEFSNCVWGFYVLKF